MKKSVLVVIATIFVQVVVAQGLDLSAPQFDRDIINHIKRESVKLFESGKSISREKVIAQSKKTECKLNLPSRVSSRELGDNLYNEIKKSTLIICRLYKTDRGDGYNIVTASGFIIDKSGICISNHHVFDIESNASLISLTAMTSDGRVYAIDEILAASEKDDILIFKLKGASNLRPMPINSDYVIGGTIYTLSHPRNSFYNITKGIVTREWMDQRDGTKRIGIDADYAVGSSGGAVFDKYGNVIGVISSTNSVYYSRGENLQMVFKNCIPIDAIYKLIK